MTPTAALLALALTAGPGEQAQPQPAEPVRCPAAVQLRWGQDGCERYGRGEITKKQANQAARQIKALKQPSGCPDDVFTRSGVEGCKAAKRAAAPKAVEPTAPQHSPSGAASDVKASADTASPAPAAGNAAQAGDARTIEGAATQPATKQKPKASDVRAPTAKPDATKPDAGR